jgi:hypothetical protein
MSRPSDPLLGFLRDVIRRKSLTTQALAEKAGIDRSILKRRLSGTEAMTVDDLVLLSNALELGPDELQFPAAPGPVLTPSVASGGLAVTHGGEQQDDEPDDALDDDSPDPAGSLPKQVVRLAFALGIDVMLMFDSTQLGASGVPASVLSRFKELMPIRLEAKFHRHNKPVFGDDEFQCVLSFDRLYTCNFPWTAFRQVHFILPVEEPVVPEPEPPKPAGKPFLRVIK